MDVKRKIKQAYCPPGIVEGEPQPIDNQQPTHLSTGYACFTRQDVANPLSNKHSMVADSFLLAAGNPCLDWMRHIVFGRHDAVTIPRKPENGGDVTYTRCAHAVMASAMAFD